MAAGRRAYAMMTGAILAAVVCCAGCTGCEEEAARGVERVRLGDKTFYLEVVNTNETRTKGLSGRDYIAPDGGMLFVFPDGQVDVQRFVMRDCPIPIDIIYLNPNGRIIAMYEMTPEPPRAEGEGEPGTFNQTYEARLKKYSSRFPSQFVIEIRGGTLPSLGLEAGDQIELDLARLKEAAQ